MTTSATGDDTLLRFVLEASGVSGVLVRLDRTWASIRERVDYPPAVAACLGETLVATALMTGHAKVDGRLSVQLRGTGALRSLFAECTRAGTLRGLAEYSVPLPDPLGPRAFGENSLLAITIENAASGGREGMRYQGLVGLEADTMAEAFQGYFTQSEQLPTRMLLAVDARSAVGIMLQKLPGTEDADADGWQRAVALFETLGSTEMLATAPDDLLFRLFHEDRVRVRDTRSLRFGCSCSRERVAEMLQSLGREEALAAVLVDANGSRHPQTESRVSSSYHGTPESTHGAGEAEVSCAFCGRIYRLPRQEILALFEQPSTAPGSGTLQ